MIVYVLHVVMGDDRSSVASVSHTTGVLSVLCDGVGPCTHLQLSLLSRSSLQDRCQSGSCWPGPQGSGAVQRGMFGSRQVEA